MSDALQGELLGPELETGITRHKSRFHQRASRSAVDCLQDMLKVRTSNARSAMQKRFVKIGRKRREVFNLFEQFCRPMEVRLNYPSTLNLPAGLSASECAAWIDESNLAWANHLVEQMASDKVGRVVYTGDDSLNYRFYEVEKRRGIWNNNLARTATEHSVVNARYIPFPAAGIEMPRKAEVMRDLIVKASPEVSRHFAVITGMLAEKRSYVADQWQEDTAFKRVVTSTTTKTIAAIGAGVAGLAVLGSALAGAVGTTGAVVATAVADPAIVFGDIAFFGWE